MSNAPSYFISHGSPMFAIEPGRLGPLLSERGRQLRDVRAVLVVSPHWQTRGLRISAAPAPETIHDFGGFPAALYQLQYRPPGQPEIAADAARLLAQAGFDVSLDPARGLDHGAWVPLRHLLPKADVPVFQVSLPIGFNAGDALRLGRALAPLRARGVAIIGSGSMTHNLYEFRQTINDPEYAQRFTDWVRAAVAGRKLSALVDYRQQAPQATRAHPTEEHFLPLFVAWGAAGGQALAERVVAGFEAGALAMDSYRFAPARISSPGKA